MNKDFSIKHTACMKKLSILAAILAMGTMCITGCNMGGANSSGTAVPEARNIAVQEETPAPTPDDNCNGDDNCHRDRMPHKKPSFKFRVPQGKHDKKGRGKFRRPHKRPAPAPEPENPEAPEENVNN